MRRLPADPGPLLAALDPAAPLAQRHLQLIALLDWVRGDGRSVEGATGRIAELVAAVEQDAELQVRLQAWWLALI